MKTPGKRTCITGILLCIVVFLFAFLMNTWLQLLSMLLLLIFVMVLLVNIISVPFLWKKNGSHALIPIGLSLIFVLLLIPSVYLGGQARMLKFRIQKPKYEEVIALIIKGEISVSNRIERIEVPAEYNHLAYAIIGNRDTNGILTVEFLTGGGFPVKHTGFL
jgi:energy-coupling factor transporter transmembrane protein EcfT